LHHHSQRRADFANPQIIIHRQPPRLQEWPNQPPLPKRQYSVVNTPPNIPPNPYPQGGEFRARESCSFELSPLLREKIPRRFIGHHPRLVRRACRGLRQICLSQCR
jgi:hypothetical protein